MKFETKEEVDEYFSGEKIECLECGKMFFSLGNHITRIHHISVDEYKTKYGLPATRGLAGTIAYKNYSDHVKDLMERGLVKLSCKFPEKTRNAPRKRVPYYVRTMAKNSYENSGLKKYVDSRKLSADVENKIIEMIQQTDAEFPEICKKLKLSHSSIRHFYYRKPEFFQKISEAREVYRKKKVEQVQMLLKKYSRKEVAKQLHISISQVRCIALEIERWSPSREAIRKENCKMNDFF